MTELANAFRPSDPGWDEARQAWNLAVDQQPDLVVVPESAEEVAAAVRHAGENDLAVAPQGPGHAAGAHSSLDGVMLLRTTKLTGVEVDPDTGTARVGGGTESAELAETAGAHGLSGLGGSSPDVGVAGYTLGGGVGWLARKHGLACNRIVGAELVTADGELRRVDADNDAELLWALKGGGGAFGVVCSLDLELVPAGELYGGLVAWPVEAAPDLLEAYREWTASLPDEVTPSLRFLRLPPLPFVPEPLQGQPRMALTAVRIGGEEEGREALAPMMDVAEPVMNMMGPLPPAALCRIHGDPEQPVPGLADGFVLESFEAGTAQALIDVAGAGADSALLAVEIRTLGGALTRAPEDAGALATVHGGYTVGSAGMAPDVNAARAVHAHQAGLREAMDPWVSERSYLNFAESVVDTAVGFEPGSYRKLQEIKKRVDPDDVIRSDHPIPPAG